MLVTLFLWGPPVRHYSRANSNMSLARTAKDISEVGPSSGSSFIGILCIIDIRTSIKLKGNDNLRELTLSLERPPLNTLPGSFDSSAPQIDHSNQYR